METKEFYPRNRRTVSDRKKLDQPQGARDRQARYGQPGKSPTAIEASASTIGHLGFTGTCFWIDPGQELIYIFLCNRVYPSRTHGALSQLNIRPELFSDHLQVHKKSFEIE